MNEPPQLMMKGKVFSWGLMGGDLLFDVQPISGKWENAFRETLAHKLARYNGQLVRVEVYLEADGEMRDG